ncbi:cytochrome P450 [Xylariaceae sp. FL0255]|nr:cytochrome P450 [Xylariaceae sp. FL0255]
MGLPYPWRQIAAGSLVASWFLVVHQSNWWKLHYISTFFSAFVFQSALWSFYAVVLYPYFLSPLRHLPEPKGGSWWNGQFSRISNEPTGIPMRDWVSTVPNDGIMRYRGLFNSERVLVTGAKALSEVLTIKNYDFQKPASLRFGISRILGVGVLLAEGEEHKIQRKNLMPAFAFRHVKDLYPVFWQKTREVVQAITKGEVSAGGANTAVIEVGGWASRVTLDIIGVAGLGKDFGAIQDHNSELNVVYRKLFQPTKMAQLMGFLGLFISPRLLSFLPIDHNDNINGASKHIRSVCRQLIADKKNKMARKEPVAHDILTVALESGGFTDEELVDQLMTFLAAGHETTATAMTWAIYMLSKMPEFQERLRQEVREKLPSVNSDVDITSIDIDHMPLLNAFCNEILRYYAPVALTLRETARDTSVMGHPIPKGTRVILCPWAVNFNKDLWGPDAHEFNPERWLGDDKRAASGGATSNYALLTFLHGPRSCIGAAFARAEFACLVAGWAGRFSFELHNKEEMDETKIDIKGGITSRPSKGMYVHATIVDGW